MDAVGLAIFLAVAVERFVAGFITPIFDKFSLDKFWLMYVAWILSGVLVFLAGINLFSDLLPDLNPVVGQIISAFLGGGGANILHDWKDKAPQKP